MKRKSTMPYINRLMNTECHYQKSLSLLIEGKKVDNNNHDCDVIFIGY